MDQDVKQLQQKIEEQGVKIDAVYASVEKTRRYFIITAWVTILAIIIPMIGLVFVIPSFISNYTNILNSLGN